MQPFREEDRKKKRKKNTNIEMYKNQASFDMVQIKGQLTNLMKLKNNNLDTF